MAAGRISSQDRKDLERFTKFLIYKSLQIIVQSRLGEKIKTQSKSVSSGADWFNIAIKDIPDVQSEAKKLLLGNPFGVGQTLCLEISLKTPDGDTMILEIWFLTMTEQCDSSMRTPHTAYYRMGIALKSVFSISRVTPAYKLSRQQTADNYVVCYKMYFGEPKYYQLGDGYKTSKVAVVPMVTGTVNIQVAYRTKLQISPHRNNCNKGFDLKPDHFMNDNSPLKKPRPCNNEYNRDMCQGHRASDTVDIIAMRDSNQDRLNHNCIEANGCVMNGDLVTVNGGPKEQHYVTSQPIAITKQPGYDARPDDFMPHSNPDASPSPVVHRRVSAFARQRTLRDCSMDLDEVPFASLLQTKDSMGVPNGILPSVDKCRGNDSTMRDSGSDDSKRSSTIKNSSSPVGEIENDGEDFVMLELKTPFAGADSGSELNQFYRECQTAPALSMFTAEPDVDVAINSITQQLHMFETSMKDFDNFVSSLQDSD